MASEFIEALRRDGRIQPKPERSPEEAAALIALPRACLLKLAAFAATAAVSIAGMVVQIVAPSAHASWLPLDARWSLHLLALFLTLGVMAALTRYRHEALLKLAYGDFGLRYGRWVDESRMAIDAALAEGVYPEFTKDFPHGRG